MATVVYGVLFAALLAVFLLLPKQRRTKTVGVSLLAVALLLELFVVNFHSYHLWGGDYKETAVDLSAENVTVSATEGESLTVEINDLDQPIGTIYLACEMAYQSEESVGTPYINVKIDACDETQQGYYRSAVAEGQIIRGDGRSAYLVTDLSGNVSDLRIRLTAKKDASFTLSAVTLNAPIPLRLSPLRLLLFVGIFFAIYALATFPSMLAVYGEKRLFCRRVSLGITAVLLLVAVALTFLSQYDRGGGISSGFLQTSGNQISQELVDAFEAGQVSLLDTPPKELLELDNPYDWSQRVQAGVSYKWDHLLYEGKYYSYYGIAPVFLLFLPYHLLTGYYFPTPEAVLLFGGLGILFLSLLYLAFCDRFAKRVPVNMVLSGLLILQFSCGVWYNFGSPLFYEIAQASGFAFTCMGFFFLLRANVIGDEGNVHLPSVTLSALFLSLAVLCRPTLALYCIAALIPLYFGLRKHRAAICEGEATEKRRLRRGTVVYLLCALAPFVLLGGAQMLYNYARFGSPFDFGIQYSLTINDFTKAQYHTDLAMIGFYNFLFAFPTVRPAFPYVFSNFSDLDANGYYFIANTNAIGIFPRALPSLGYLGGLHAWRVLTKRERVLALSIGVPICLFVPLGIIFSIWESGYGVRYCADFAWELILGGMAVLFLLYARLAEGQTKRLLQGFFLVSLLVAFVCNFAMVYEYMSKSGYLEADYLRFARLFDFWK